MISALLLLLAAPTAAPAPAIAAPVEARIPFPNLRLRNFQAGRGPEEREVVYLQTSSRRWYRAQLDGPCPELPFANAIGVDTRGSRTLDRFSSLLIGRDRCQIRSLVEVPGPPPKRRRRA